MAEQLSLDLFPKERPKTLYEHFLDWAHRIHGCPPEIDPIAKNVFDTMDEPFDRCKALVTICRAGRFDQAEVDALGLFEQVDYHVIWDRAWAIKHGIPIEDAHKVWQCDYNLRHPRFYDVSGNLLFTGEHDIE